MELHIEAMMPKVCLLKDGKTLALSVASGKSQKFKVSKIDKDGEKITNYESELPYGYTGSAEIAENKYENRTKSQYHLFHHNKQNVDGHQAKEYTTSFNDFGLNVNQYVRNSSLYKQTSVVSMKNGKIIIAGIVPISTDHAKTTISVIMYDPEEDKYKSGISFKAYSKYVSCYEQKDNDVYCVYVSFENVFLYKLKVKHLKITEDGLEVGDELKDEKVIKTFYTEFNFLKAVSLNTTDFLILFQTGNGKAENPHGNTGKDLFFYHLETNKDHLVISKRYEFLYDNCRYREDPEDYNADIFVYSQKSIFAVCETNENKFRGFIINPEVKPISKFNFDNFGASDVKNPVFAKFDKTLALFYTYISETLTRSTKYMMMNYPDCVDYREQTINLPQNRSYELDLDGKVFLVNAYPADKQDTPIKVRIINKSNASIYDVDTKQYISLNTDFEPDDTLRIWPDSAEGVYSIEYTATREDPIDGLITGKTCKITFKTPVCLPQCITCTEKGTDDSHKCLGCKEGYYKEEDPKIKEEDYFGIEKPHNCKNCNISCTTCFGPFLSPPKAVQETTNCRRCNYEDSYFPYEDENKTCISIETQEYWEKIYNRAIYLDKSGGVKEKWVWRKCHKNCKACEKGGDDIDNKCILCVKDYYFFCNQTTEFGGIPGTCYDKSYIKNGYYPTNKTDNDTRTREKLCNCFKNCKECNNDTKCEKCYNPFLLSIEHDSCDKECDYCLAEDKEAGICVDCKATNNSFTLNKTCVNSLEVNGHSHHIIDFKCNLLIGCKKGCYKCDPWYSDECTSCNASYYKEDPFGKNRKENDTFHCFDEDTCKGIIPYEHNPSLRIGGVPIFSNKEYLCLNCKFNGSYRLPEDKFYCANIKPDRTYIDIEEYNKLSECYFRCKSCETGGNSYLMNCTSCRDSNSYDFIQVAKYGIRTPYGNCYRKQHKCGIYPYYHDYDLAEFLGKDEDNCGQDCDVCLYNFSCTQNFPFFVLSTHECVEYCPITEVFGHNCNSSDYAAIINLLKNPFGLKNPYDFLNTSVTIKQFISGSFFQYFAQVYNLDITNIEKEITNYLGNGQIYNLPESQIIVGNNISIELTSVKLELEKLLNKLKGETGESESGGEQPTTNSPGGSILDLSECEALLKKKYGLSDEEDLMIIKGDLLQQLSDDYFGNQVEYQIFSTSLGAFLPLSDCKDGGASVTVTNPFSAISLLTQYQSKTGAVTGNGYNAFDVNSPFYNDVCTPFTNENGNDVLLDDRRKDYYNENINLCEKDCQFVGYNTSTNMYTCICNIKETPGSVAGEFTGDYVKKEMPENFRDMISKRSNIEVFKCASQVFSSKGQKMNFGSYIILAGFASFVGAIVFHFVRERKIDFNNLSVSNPPKPISTKEEKESKKSKKNKDKKDDKKEKKHSKDDKKEKKKDNNEKVRAPHEKVKIDSHGAPSKYPLTKPKNVNKDFVLKEDQLNFAPFDVAVEKDKRSFARYYWSLLKMKQLCLFTFYTSEDYILRTTKIVLFILFISFYLSFTALFFNDSIMRAIYIYKGNTDAAIHIPNILLSSLCCLVMSLIVRFVSLNERDISKIIQSPPEERKQLADKLLKISQIKLIILYVLTGVLTTLCWYYVSAFCAVFKNSQGPYFINTLVSFIICNLWPCATSLIPCFLRRKALDNGSETLYKVSQIISYF